MDDEHRANEDNVVLIVDAHFGQSLIAAIFNDLGLSLRIGKVDLSLNWPIVFTCILQLKIELEKLF